jgi:small subunit ribosomal protein S16
MPVKIRLMRIGTNRRPFYRVVAVDERKKRTGGYLELLGTYNPLTEPKEINLDQPKIDAWIKKGAQPSEGFLRIIGKAPQRPPRKPKKAPKEAPAAPAAATPKEEVAPESAVEETAAPAENVADASVEEVKAEEAASEAPAEETTAENPSEDKTEEAAA